MSGQRQQIEPKRGYVDRHLAGRLRGVGVQQRAVRVRDRRDLGHRLHNADFVVGGHHRHEDGPAVNRGAERVEIDDAVGWTPTPVTRQPSRSSRAQESSTDLCSVATVMT